MAARGRRPPPSARRTRRTGRRNTRSDFGARVLAAIPAIAFAIFIIDSGGLIFVLGLIAVGWACMDELYRLYERARPLRLAGLIGLAGLLVAAQYGTQFHVLLAAVVLVPVTFALVLIAPRGGVASMALTLFGVWWVAFALAHAVLLRALPHGEGIVIDVLVGTFLGDTGAYLGGRLVGRQPLAPRLSPNKTVEGLLIGFVVAVFAVWFASLYQDWMDKGNALLLGVAVGIAAPIGDLFESFVKREAGAKDTGRLFGPHGGALDRLDAVLFTAVTGYYVWHAMLMA
jgi:phosphatidate cytidylyltransferase